MIFGIAQKVLGKWCRWPDLNGRPTDYESDIRGICVNGLCPDCQIYHAKRDLLCLNGLGYVRRQIFGGASARIIAALAVLFCNSASAGMYFGVVATQSYTDFQYNPPPHTYDSTGFYDIDRDSRQSHLVVGVQWRWLLIEYGNGRLSQWRGHNYGPIEGRPAPCCDVTQIVTTDYKYTAVGLAVPVSQSVEVFGLWGRAVVRIENDESGTTVAGPGRGHVHWTEDSSPIRILGTKWHPTEHIALRLEYTTVKNIGAGTGGKDLHYTWYNGQPADFTRTIRPEGLFGSPYDVSAIGIGLEVHF